MYCIPPHRRQKVLDAIEGGTKELYQISHKHHEVNSDNLQRALEKTGADETSKLNWIVPGLVPAGEAWVLGRWLTASFQGCPVWPPLSLFGSPCLHP